MSEARHPTGEPLAPESYRPGVLPGSTRPGSPPSSSRPGLLPGSRSGRSGLLSGEPGAQASPIVVGLLLASVAVAALAAIVTGLMTWRESSENQRLRNELTALQRERHQVQADLRSMQATVTVLEQRLVLIAETPPGNEGYSSGSLAGATEGDDLEGRLSEIESRLDSLAELQARIDRLQTAPQAPSSWPGLLPGSDVADAAQAPPSTEQYPVEAGLVVARQRQSHNLSCESSAASMVAHYHGVSLSEAEVLAALPLDENPHLGFRGDVDGPTGGLQDYGVYAGPILDILNGHGLQASLVQGGLEGIKRAIARGNPVITWVTHNCQTETPTTEVIGGQSVTLVPYQHVVVVTGYEPEGVWANDPWDGAEDYYSISDFVRAMSYFGDMAIEVAAAP
jgi:uncharacterized protein YvpB